MVVGTKEDAKKQVEHLQSKVKFDELMVNCYIYDEEKWLRSYKLFSEVIQELNK